MLLLVLCRWCYGGGRVAGLGLGSGLQSAWLGLQRQGEAMGFGAGGRVHPYPLPPMENSVFGGYDV